MNEQKIPFSPPDIGASEIQYVIEALQSGWITTGPKTKQFEKALAEYSGVNRMVCLNSATACLEMTLRLLEIGPGDEVIVPAYTYTASCSPICHVGATPIIVDTAEHSLEMDYEQLYEVINERTKAIIPVDIAGILCDYERLYSVLAAKKQLYRPSNKLQRAFDRVPVIADCAHGFGAIYDGKRAGAFADFTTYSFHAVKNLTTAEGGAVTWRPISGIADEDIYHQFQLLSLHGQTKDALHKNKLGAWEYDIVSPAYKCNMTDIHASIGLAQLQRYDALLKRRHEIVARYDEAFADYPLHVLNHSSSKHRSSAHLYLTRVEQISEAQRNRLIERMAERGIACNVHYKPLPMLTAYKKMGFDIKDYPNAYKQYENEITLPLYSTLSDEAVAYIIKSYQQVLEEAGCV